MGEVKTVVERGGDLVTVVVVLALLIAGSVSASEAAAETGTLSAVAWGQNVDGELGTGYKGTASNVPAAVLLSGFKSVVPGYYSTYAPMNDGTVRAWGGNDFGELGDGTTTPSDVPVTVR